MRIRKKNQKDDIPISPELLQEAISKTKHLKTVTRSDIQKLLRIGYSKAAKPYKLITNSEIKEKYDPGRSEEVNGERKSLRG